jgi:hypothetical protein
VKSSSIFWDNTPCSPVLSQQDISEKLMASILRLCLLSASCWFLAWLILRPCKCRRHVPPKRQLIFNGLHGAMSHKVELFITTDARTSNPTLYSRYESSRLEPRPKHRLS